MTDDKRIQKWENREFAMHTMRKGMDSGTGKQNDQKRKIKIFNRIKCLIGLHKYRVWSHIVNSENEVIEIIEEARIEGDNFQGILDVKYEYYYCCVYCNIAEFWDFQYIRPPQQSLIFKELKL